MDLRQDLHVGMCVAIVQLFDFMNTVFTGILKGFEKKGFQSYFGQVSATT